MVPAFILFVGLFFFPYSPRWLASKDRWEEAIQVLASLHGDGDVNHPKVLAQYQEIEEALRFEREQAISSFKALVAPRMFKRVLLGMSIQMWSQLCGMNIMVRPPITPPSPFFALSFPWRDTLFQLGRGPSLEQFGTNNPVLVNRCVSSQIFGSDRKCFQV